MTTSNPQPRATSPLGGLIRLWRDRRGQSQLALALDMGVSQRHLSFVESGRSLPSRGFLLALAGALNLPLRDRNALLLAAGLAPAYSDQPWDAAEMRPVQRALDRLLKQQEPYPAIVMDRHWNVLSTNAAAPRFFGSFIDLAQQGKPRNLLRLMFDPQAMRPFIANWHEVARGLLERVRREAVGGVVDEASRALVAELMAFPDAPDGWSEEDEQAADAVIPIAFELQGRLLRYFSMVSTVGTPRTMAAQELRVESMFPADDATEAWHQEIFGGGA